MNQRARHFWTVAEMLVNAALPPRTYMSTRLAVLARRAIITQQTFHITFDTRENRLWQPCNAWRSDEMSGAAE